MEATVLSDCKQSHVTVTVSLPPVRFFLSASGFPVIIKSQPATYNLQPTTCNLQPTTCNLQPTTYNLQPANYTCRRAALLGNAKTNPPEQVQRQAARFVTRTYSREEGLKH